MKRSTLKFLCVRETWVHVTMRKPLKLVNRRVLQVAVRGCVM